MHKWQLYEAKNKLSQLFDNAISGSVECITRRGKEAVIVISMKEYEKLKEPKLNFKEFLLTAPKIDDLEFTRAKAKMRKVEL